MTNFVNGKRTHLKVTPLETESPGRVHLAVFTPDSSVIVIDTQSGKTVLSGSHPLVLSFPLYLCTHDLTVKFCLTETKKMIFNANFRFETLLMLKNPVNSAVGPMLTQHGHRIMIIL